MRGLVGIAVLLSCNGDIDPNVLAFAQDCPSSLVIDGTHAYWTNTGRDHDHGGVMKVPLVGGKPVELSSGKSAWGIAVDGTSVYWTSYTLGVVVKQPLGGGGETTLASGLDHPDAIAVDGTNVSWGALDGVAKQPLSGGTATNVASEIGGHDVVLHDGDLYWTSYAHGTVNRTSADGSLVVLASGQSHPLGIVVDGPNVYWTNGGSDSSAGDGSVMRAPSSGGAATVLASAQAYPISIAVDESFVYWTNYEGGTVVKLPKQGGDIVVLAASRNPESVAVDGSNVYWASCEEGAVRKIPKIK